MKKLQLWFIAHGIDTLTYAVIVLFLLGILYGLSLLAMFLIESRSLTLLAGGVVLVGAVIGVEVTAIQWIAGRD